MDADGGAIHAPCANFTVLFMNGTRDVRWALPLITSRVCIGYNAGPMQSYLYVSRFCDAPSRCHRPQELPYSVAVQQTVRFNLHIASRVSVSGGRKTSCTIYMYIVHIGQSLHMLECSVRLRCPLSYTYNKCSCTQPVCRLSDMELENDSMTCASCTRSTTQTNNTHNLHIHANGGDRSDALLYQSVHCSQTWMHINLNFECQTKSYVSLWFVVHNTMKLKRPDGGENSLLRTVAHSQVMICIANPNDRMFVICVIVAFHKSRRHFFLSSTVFPSYSVCVRARANRIHGSLRRALAHSHTAVDSSMFTQWLAINASVIIFDINRTNDWTAAAANKTAGSSSHHKNNNSTRVCSESSSSFAMRSSAAAAAVLLLLLRIVHNFFLLFFTVSHEHKQELGKLPRYCG